MGNNKQPLIYLSVGSTNYDKVSFTIPQCRAY